MCIYLILIILKQISGNGALYFEITSSRGTNEPPIIQVTFPNGVQDKIDLGQYNFHGNANKKCNYIGRLHNDITSSVAVTGCLYKEGDTMEITLRSRNNVNQLFKVDFYGNTEILENPFDNKAMIDMAN